MIKETLEIKLHPVNGFGNNQNLIFNDKIMTDKNRSQLSLSNLSIIICSVRFPVQIIFIHLIYKDINS